MSEFKVLRYWIASILLMSGSLLMDRHLQHSRIQSIIERVEKAEEGLSQNDLKNDIELTLLSEEVFKLSPRWISTTRFALQNRVWNLREEIMQVQITSSSP